VTEDAALTRHQTVTEIVRLYAEAEQDVRAAFERIADAESRLKDAFGKIWLHDHYGRALDWGRPEGVLEAMRRDAWSCLVERLELRRMMSVKRAKDLDEQLRHGDLPPITVENVEAFARGYSEQLPDMLREAVAEVYDWLRPRDGSFRAEYKTNNRVEVGRRVIVRILECGWSKWHVSHHWQPDLTALDNVFRALDGGGGTQQSHYGELYDAISGAGRDGKWETRYFRGRNFKNQNVHIEFTRADLLARFNAIAGGKNLRPGKAA